MKFNRIHAAFIALGVTLGCIVAIVYLWKEPLIYPLSFLACCSFIVLMWQSLSCHDRGRHY